MRTQFIIGGLLAMDGGWLMLAGLPLISAGLAVCLVALSNGKALRIVAGSVVIVSGLLLAGYGIVADMGDRWHSDDPRPWCFISGLTMAAVGSASAIDGLVGPHQGSE
jgi:hypothetical protein